MPTLDTIVALAKRRGFVYPGSEIYGGFVGVYDYGPYGVLLANNIKNAWWRAMVQLEDNIVGLDSAIVTQPKVWVASGHVGGFSDPLVECKECHVRSRADHLIEEVGGTADEKMSLEDLNTIFDGLRDSIQCPACRKKNFTAVKTFNLLVQSNLGNFSDDWTKDPTYLRGETCQGIYINFKNVVDTTRVKVPFGIAQIGKAFRNEIAPRQYIFRKREFEQMEMQMFVRPDTAMDLYEVWREKRMQYYLDLGFKKENLNGTSTRTSSSMPKRHGTSNIAIRLVSKSLKEFMRVATTTSPNTRRTQVPICRTVTRLRTSSLYHTLLRPQSVSTERSLQYSLNFMTKTRSVGNNAWSCVFRRHSHP